MRYGKSIQDILAGVVIKVNQKTIAKLKVANPDIQSVRFEYGHPKELIASLQTRSNDPGNGSGTDGKYDMFPLIMLFTDVNEEFGSNASYPNMSVNVVIAMSTTPTLKAAERDEKNFIPILEPIYREFIKQLDRSVNLKTQSAKLIKHNMYKRYFWGKTGLYGNEGNIFGSAIDAIELQNLQLSIYH